MVALKITLAALILCGQASGQDILLAQADETLEFLAEEARVVSASAGAQPVSRAPSTTRVLTGNEIRSSGASTLWDALRMVPGVDVAAIRAYQGAVGLRGLNKTSNNRTLVLVDGRTVLDPNFDFVVWGTIPVTLDDIERIEIVEGPASALYGANAVSGVINIITKTPEESRGGRGRLTMGERNQIVATHHFAEVKEDRAAKYTAGYRTTSGFEHSRRKEAESAMVTGLNRWRIGEDGELALSAGFTRHDIHTADAPNFSRDSGVTGYGRADLRLGATKARAFWNAKRADLKDNPGLNHPALNHDMFDGLLQRSFELGDSHKLAAGASYRRNSARSGLYPMPVHQDLFGAFVADEWAVADGWTVFADGRVDHHQEAGFFISPRLSVLYAPSRRHTWRLTGARAFRNPTLLENYIDVTVPTPAANVQVLGSRDFRPERMESVEAAYSGLFGRVQTTLTAFYWVLTEQIGGTTQEVVSVGPPLVTRISVTNAGATRAAGGEASVTAPLTRALSAFANYSYQSLRDDGQLLVQAVTVPRHKANAGLRARHGPWTGSIWGHWQDHTLHTQATAPVTVLGAAPAYAILNLHGGYRFSGRLEGLELAVDAFNATNYRHREMTPFVNAANPGRNASIMGSRWSGTIAYRY